MVLYGNFLTGTIPKSVEAFTGALRHLEMDGNALSGSLPPVLSSLCVGLFATDGACCSDVKSFVVVGPVDETNRQRVLLNQLN